MKGQVLEFAGGRGVIRPPDGGPDVPFEWRAIQTTPKVLMPGDEVTYEVDTTGAAVVVFLVH